MRIDLNVNEIRGGCLAWAVEADFLAESLQLVEISGINIQADFDPGFTSATATIKFLDPGHVLAQNQATGHRLAVLFEGRPIWAGQVETAEIEGEQVTLTATGDLSRVDKNYTFYRVPAMTPRAAALRWLEGATGQTIAGADYRDNYYLSRARVAPPAATLGKWPEPFSYERPHLWGYQAQADGSGNYQPVTIDMGTPAAGPWLKISDFSPCPDGISPSLTGCRANPVLFHKANTSFYINVSLGATDAPAWGGKTAPANCNWLTGRDQWVKLTAGRVASDSANMWQISGGGVTPSETKTTRVRTAGFAEIIGQSIALSLTGVGWHKLAGYSKTVSQGVFESSRITAAAQCWAKWGGGTAPAWVSSDKIQDSMEFGDCLAGRAIASVESIYGASFSAEYLHPDTHGWTGAALTADCVEYSFQQTFQPVTISQDDWTEDHALQAAWLGGVCPAESPYSQDIGIRFVDLIPESGEIYPVPLDVSNAGSMTLAETRPIPGIISCAYRDALGNENKITTASFNGNNTEKELTILQGAFLSSDASQTAVIEGDLDTFSVQYYTRSANTWTTGPGALADRYSGIEYTGGQIRAVEIPTDWTHQEYEPGGGITYPGSAFSLFGFCFVDKDGKINPCPRSPFFVGSVGPSLSGYSVRDKTGQEFALFSQYVQICTFTQNGPGLDFFPAMAMKKAMERVYSMPDRPIYSVTAGWQFAGIELGAVVLINSKNWDNGRPWLALVIGKTVGTDQAGVNLRLAPMHPVTDADRETWEGLGGLLDRVVYKDVIWQPEPPPPGPAVFEAHIFGEPWGRYSSGAYIRSLTTQGYSDEAQKATILSWKDGYLPTPGRLKFKAQDGEIKTFEATSATSSFINFDPTPAVELMASGCRLFASAAACYIQLTVATAYRANFVSQPYWSKVFNDDYSLKTGVDVWLEIDPE